MSSTPTQLETPDGDAKLSGELGRGVVSENISGTGAGQGQIDRSEGVDKSALILGIRGVDSPAQSPPTHGLLPGGAWGGPVRVCRGPVRAWRGGRSGSGGPVRVYRGPVRVCRGPFRVCRGPVRVCRGPVNVCRGLVRVCRGPVRVCRELVRVCRGPVRAWRGPVRVWGAGQGL